MQSTKKAKPNGFTSFVKDWRERGASQLHWKACINEAGKIWETMSMEERQPYHDAARKMRKVKRACTSQTVAELKKQEESEEQQRKMQHHIENTVRDSVNRAELETHNYCFVMLNYFTKATVTDVYTPAELSASHFSLLEGVQSIYHTLVNPGFNVYGSLLETQQHSQATHRLPVPPNALGDANMEQVYKDLLSFVRNNSKSNGDNDNKDAEEGDQLTPVYTLQEHIPIVSSALKFLNSGAPSKLKIYSIEYLFYILKEATCEAGGLPPPKSIHITNSQFALDTYEFQSDIGCQFHHKRDISKYCAKSYVTRWGFMFANYMCSDLAIKMRLNRHMPDNMNLRITIIDPDAKTEVEKNGIKEKNDLAVKRKEESDEENEFEDYDVVESANIDEIMSLELWDDLDHIIEVDNLENSGDDAPPAPSITQEDLKGEIFTRRSKSGIHYEMDEAEITPYNTDAQEIELQKRTSSPKEHVALQNDTDLERWRSSSRSYRKTKHRKNISPGSRQSSANRSTSRNRIRVHSRRSITPRGRHDNLKGCGSRDGRRSSPRRNRGSVRARRSISPRRRRKNFSRSKSRDGSSPRRNREFCTRLGAKKRSVSPRSKQKSRRRSTSRDPGNRRISPGSTYGFRERERRDYNTRYSRPLNCRGRGRGNYRQNRRERSSSNERAKSWYNRKLRSNSRSLSPRARKISPHKSCQKHRFNRQRSTSKNSPSMRESTSPQSSLKNDSQTISGDYNSVLQNSTPAYKHIDNSKAPRKHLLPNPTPPQPYSIENHHACENYAQPLIYGLEPPPLGPHDLRHRLGAARPDRYLREDDLRNPQHNGNGFVAPSNDVIGIAHGEFLNELPQQHPPSYDWGYGQLPSYYGGYEGYY